MDMHTTTTTAATMASMTMSAASPSSTSSSMDMSSSHSSMSMTMFFVTSATTPLYSSSWTPTGTGSYAGTCIFLIALATLHCLLLSVRNALAASVWHRPRRDAADEKPHPVEELVGVDDDDGSGRFGRALRGSWSGHPFHMATETARAAFEVVVSGIGYLLMLAVMTMNVGYFLSVLGGIFLGTLLVGRFGGFGFHH